jgi:hypothetical protein
VQQPEARAGREARRTGLRRPEAGLSCDGGRVRMHLLGMAPAAGRLVSEPDVCCQDFEGIP